MTGLSERDKAILNCVFNPNLPLDEAAYDNFEELEDSEDLCEEIEQCKKMEVRAIEIAESGNLNDGLDLISKAIQIAPNKPSLYNNRAHIYQYLRNFDEALIDLNKAIELCTDKTKKTFCNAHCQRGLLHRRADRLDEARADFEVAAKLGNKFAKNQLVELNPYAALCNQMLKQVMETLK